MSQNKWTLERNPIVLDDIIRDESGNIVAYIPANMLVNANRLALANETYSFILRLVAYYDSGCQLDEYNLKALISEARQILAKADGKEGDK